MSEQNNNRTDDVIELIKKKHTPTATDAPTRIDNSVVQKKPSAPVSRPPQPRREASGVSNGASGVSLSDFDMISKTNPKTSTAKKEKLKFPRYAKVLIYLICLLLVSIILSVTAINVGNDVFAFVKQDKEITINLESGDTLSDVADELKEKGVIKYPFIYKLYSHLRMDGREYYTGDWLSGEHVLNSNLSYDKLISKLAESSYSSEIVRVTIPEGYALHEIIDLFIEKRIVSEKNKEKLIAALNSLEYEFDFIPEFSENEGKDRIYMLEGYIFPDTYDFYVNENIDSIINKFLTNFNKKFEEAYYDRAKALGLTVDEVITIASMIQAEGNNDEDYYKISSVFHNRLKSSSFPFLNSDATTLYSFQGEKKQLEAGDNKTKVHPYNTYLNRGLPPGPICNPGSEAIHAALYPESTSYYYFYTASSNGVTYFSTNEAQHNRYIQQDINGTLN